MKKEEILQLAQNGKDEREETMTIQAGKVAGRFSILFTCCLTLFVVIDGYILRSGREYDFLTVAWMLVAVGAIYNAIFSAYQVLKINKHTRIKALIVFGAVFVWALVKIVLFYIP